jgi:hypothetical protein
MTAEPLAGVPGDALRAQVGQPPAGTTVATLAEIKARLDERQKFDAAKLPTHYHELLGLVHIGPMPTAAYSAIEAAETDLPAHWGGEGAKQSVWPPTNSRTMKDYMRFRVYMEHGVWTADGKRLESDIVEEMLKGPFGGENEKLINAIKKQNPPRAYLVAEMAVVYGFSRSAVVLMRVLEKAGMLALARDYLAGNAGEEEYERAAADLRKFEETLPYWEAILEAEEFAKQTGLSIYDAAEQRAQATSDVMNGVPAATAPAEPLAEASAA